MAIEGSNSILFSILLPIIFSNTCAAIKCFDCNSVNNSACLEMHLNHMHAIVPVVECGSALPNALNKQFFCRKITQTILHHEKTPEVRIIRSCGWIKHKRECYKADNSDHLETVCQCFGDMCNAAAALDNIKTTALAAFTALFVMLRSWRERKE